ncbi:hypothetical protein, partial [Neisseria meningitidis]|uniref:hypothetical protein n=1 Tax=Neisseria meningitidis TaxID=487 RepID=UPI001C55D744
GEIMYFKNQQLLARYCLERIALNMPSVDPLIWSKPIRVGYNPKVSYSNGESFLTRPDNFMPEKSPSIWLIKHSKNIERRLQDSIDFGRLMPEDPMNFKEGVNLHNKDGTNMLGYAATGHYGRKFYGNYYWQTLDALSSMIKTKDDRSFKGGVLNVPQLGMRDPAFFSFLKSFVHMFDSHKKTLHPYMRPDVLFPGVTIKSFVADKLVTFIEKFDFEITNGLAVKDPKEYIDLKYHASQYRVNHKPYVFKMDVNSEKETNAIVTIFIGPHRDAEFKPLSLEQKRLMFVVMDRFVVKLKAGQNMIERSSKEATYAFSDRLGFRALYSRIESAKKGEQFFKAQGTTCGFPEHLQLPMGSPAGTKFTFAVVITPAKENVEQLPKGHFCMYPRMKDDHAMMFPFDRHIHDETMFHVPNIYFEDMPIYYKTESDINRPEQN